MTENSASNELTGEFNALGITEKKRQDLSDGLTAFT